MTIQVYTTDEKQERALLAFLDSGHYSYRSDDDQTESFLTEYNKELDSAEQQIDSGDFLSHEAVKNVLFNK